MVGWSCPPVCSYSFQNCFSSYKIPTYPFHAGRDMFPCVSGTRLCNMLSCALYGLMLLTSVMDKTHKICYSLVVGTCSPACTAYGGRSYFLLCTVDRCQSAVHCRSVMSPSYNKCHNLICESVSTCHVYKQISPNYRHVHSQGHITMGSTF